MNPSLVKLGLLALDTVDHTLTQSGSLIGGTIGHDGTGVVGSLDGLTASPDGTTLYATVNRGAHVPAAGVWVEHAGYGNAIAFRADGYCVWDNSVGRVRAFNYQDAPLAFPATGATEIAVPNGTWGHGMVVTE